MASRSAFFLENVPLIEAYIQGNYNALLQVQETQGPSKFLL